jgi:hypothetical protein
MIGRRCPDRLDRPSVAPLERAKNHHRKRQPTSSRLISASFVDVSLAMDFFFFYNFV